MTQLSIDIDDTILQRAHVRAAAEGTSVNAKVREFLDLYTKADRITDTALSELPIFKGSTGLQQGIDPRSNQSMRQAAEH